MIFIIVYRGSSFESLLSVMWLRLVIIEAVNGPNTGFVLGGFIVLLILITIVEHSSSSVPDSKVAVSPNLISNSSLSQLQLSSASHSPVLLQQIPEPIVLHFMYSGETLIELPSQYRLISIASKSLPNSYSGKTKLPFAS